MISKTILNLQELKKEFSLMIKIHPTSENYKEYETILKSFENVNLNQIDDVVDLLEKWFIVHVIH